MPSAYAQYENESDATIPLDKFYIKRQGSGGLRRILTKLHWGLSTGYGSSTLKHKLDGYSILQNPDSAVRIFSNADPSKAYANWFNNSVPVDVGNSASAPGSNVVSSQNSKIGFKSKAFSIPFKATVHYEFNRYRIGGGYSIEYMHIGPFVPISHGDKVHGFAPQVSSLWMKHYFGMLGGMVYRYNEYDLVVDANIGGYKLGGGFNSGLIKKGIYFNLGVTAEREMSEYFRLFVRPSYEIKSYTLSMPDASQSIKHRFNAFYLNIGATYRIPELRRCFLKDCHAQLNHAHGNKEYRSRRHPIYKKQNPHYGENYPVILKYKGRNKKKLNPY
ncbi:MAG TPA: hypothetical protein VL443_04720 [Cyclobacteriaceae bacterium]|nr:hypothetical protein [Cyclobacteriaceae bacterium]